MSLRRKETDWYEVRGKVEFELSWKIDNRYNLFWNSEPGKAVREDGT